MAEPSERRPQFEVAQSERAAAEARLAETLRRRDELPWWKRKVREELDRQAQVQTRAAQYWRQQTDRLDAQRRLAAERSDADSRAAHGAERLRLQAADRAAVIELLTAPEPPTASLGLEVEDCGLEL